MDEVVLAHRFELRDKLGEGGMGVVYRAWDRSLGKDVALKRMRGVGVADAHALKSEFRARAALQHRGIVQLYELVVDGEDCFLTMELVDGTDLASWVRGEREASGTHREARTRRTVRRGRLRSGAAVGLDPDHVEAPLDPDGAARLRAALTELAGALVVLHDAGIVHRDLTPANVRVAPGGRVVVLDFGLAGSSGVGTPGSDGAIVGTAVYMAPEQVRAETTTAAVDLYAVGVIIYELLAGRPPFLGAEELVHYAKASGTRPEPLVDTADDELAALAMALLAPAPQERPGARQVLAQLAGGERPLAPTFGGAGGARGFFGRTAELDRLDAALRRVLAERRPIAVVVEGPSGIGKSTVLRRFVTDLERGTPGVTVLSARCHPQEIVPFKAVDAAVDTLAERAASCELGGFEPAVAQAALRLFPALGAVPALARASASQVSRDDPELRAQGFEAVRRLLHAIAARGPLVLCLDDVQWDDADSEALLEAVLRARGAPPLLLLLGLRAGGESEIVRKLADPRAPVPLERIQLGALDDEAAARLAAVYLGEDDPRLAQVVRQSEGNPFLVSELARYLAARPVETGVDVDVKGLVAARLGELTAGERAVLDTTSLALGPIVTARALEAAGLGPQAHTAVLALRDAFLVRLGSSPAGETITPYHEKISEATRQLMSAARLGEVHRGLARTLERHTPEDVDALAIHWEGAGDKPRAARCAFGAAERAAGSLAFGHAAELYEKALVLGYDGVDAATLLERIGRALAHQGLAPAAATRYLEASYALGDDIGSARVRTLKRLAAEQYVKGGYVSLGWQVMRSVLSAAGVSQPSSPKTAMLGALARRMKFLLRRIDVDAIGDRQIPAAERPRLEILWTASTSMSMVDVTLSDAFRTQHLGRILDVGDASSVARALAYEAALEAHVGGPLFDPHVERLLSHARRLVERTGDPYDRAWLELGFANQSYCAGRFAEAVAACERSEKVLREECTGVAWERTTVAAFHLTALAMVGDLAGLRAASERLAADAERRGDLFGVAEALSGECVLGWWTLGQAEAALARAREAVVRQGAGGTRWPERTYRRGQLTELMGTVHLALIGGQPAPAWKLMLEHWAGLNDALILSLQFYRSWVRHGRARVALACARRGGAPGWPRERLLADAAELVKFMRKDSRPFAGPWTLLIEAGLSEGLERRRKLQSALLGFERAGMGLYREATRWRLGGRDEAESWLAGQGVVDVEALVEALVPGV